MKSPCLELLLQQILPSIAAKKVSCITNRNIEKSQCTAEIWDSMSNVSSEGPLSESDVTFRL